MEPPVQKRSNSREITNTDQDTLTRERARGADSEDDSESDGDGREVGSEGLLSTMNVELTDEKIREAYITLAGINDSAEDDKHKAEGGEHLHEATLPGAHAVAESGCGQERAVVHHGIRDDD